MISAPRGESFWAGLTDRDEEGTWRWVNASDPLDCSNVFCDWHVNEPGGGETESCLEVWNEAWWDEGHWNDASCTDRLTHYICEKPIAQDTTKVAWIGLNDLDSTQTLTFTDETRVTYTKW